LLREKGIPFTDIRVDEEPILRIEMTQRCGHFEVPQIWIDKQHIGGCFQLMALAQSGELDRLLAAPHFGEQAK
jgi:glutaredoxin 3